MFFGNILVTTFWQFYFGHPRARIHYFFSFVQLIFQKKRSNFFDQDCTYWIDRDRVAPRMKMDEAVHATAPEPCAKTERRDRREKARQSVSAGKKVRVEKCGWRESAGGNSVQKSAGGNSVQKCGWKCGWQTCQPVTIPRRIYLSSKVRWTYTVATLLQFRQDSRDQTV